MSNLLEIDLKRLFVRISLIIVCFVFLFNDCVAGAPGDEPSIDAFIQHAHQSADRSSVDVCSDRVFVRRVYLDLLGRIPNQAEQQSFLQLAEENRREQLVEVLLGVEEHAAYMARIFDVILMGRNESKLSQRERYGWLGYLESVFKSNKPWDEVSRDVLLARAAGEREGHLWYFYEREDNHQDIAEAVAKGFFGIDIACAQCHDHPLAMEIGQEHYWGLVSFFKRSKNAKVDNEIRISESAIGGFDRYANALDGSTDESRLVFLERNEVMEPRPEDPAKEEDCDELYEAAEGEIRVPKFSRRERFVKEILEGHPRLARSMVNRAWALMIGRGLVHPVDEMDSMHPASHPELLDWLAEDFVENNYDVRRLFRMIATSRVYQLDSRPGNLENKPLDPSLLLVANIRPLAAEQMLGSVRVALGLGLDDKALEQIKASFRLAFPDVVPKNDTSSLQQALYLSNDEKLNELVLEAARRMPDFEDVETLVHHFYLQIFGREAEVEEVDAVSKYLESSNASGANGDTVNGTLSELVGSPARARRVADVMWAMVTSAEFRFNH